jgi:predicted DNA-binding transcriptional regulator AlpA
MASRSRTPADAGIPPTASPVDPLPGERRAKLTLAEFCELMGLDRSTVLRKERQGLMPPRRLVAGMNVFLTAEVRAWLAGAKVSEGSNPRRSAIAREVDGLGRWRAKQTKLKAAETRRALKGRAPAAPIKDVTSTVLAPPKARRAPKSTGAHR